MVKGLFVSVEGGEGAGKTTVIQDVSKILKCFDLKVMVTREPGGIPISEQIPPHQGTVRGRLYANEGEPQIKKNLMGVLKDAGVNLMSFDYLPR